jgi:hypothetical protein
VDFASFSDLAYGIGVLCGGIGLLWFAVTGAAPLLALADAIRQLADAIRQRDHDREEW